MKRFDYIFIGAGSANLAAARRLCEDDPKLRILILERGQRTDKRQCPGVKPQTCFSCERGCSILSGLGGTNALYGNKLCYFPASSGILQLLQDLQAEDAWQWLEKTLTGHFEARRNRVDSELDNAARKHYHSSILSRDRFRQMIEGLAQPLIAGGCIQPNSEVSHIKRAPGGFTVHGTFGKLSAENVVLGTGRSGASFLRRVSREFGIELTENSADVGVRIEAPQTFFSSFYAYQDDPKIKVETPFGNARTFCAENRGMIVPVMFGEAFFAEGAYPQPFTSDNNVALMTRTTKVLEPKALEDWCRSINMWQRGSLLRAQVTVTDATASDVVETIANQIPALPTHSHQRLITQLLGLLTRPDSSLFRLDRRLNGTVRIYSPAIDNYWPRPKLGGNFETSARGLFVLGDAVGLSRGYVQALTTGAAWAHRQSGRSATACKANATCQNSV